MIRSGYLGDGDRGDPRLRGLATTAVVSTTGTHAAELRVGIGGWTELQLFLDLAYQAS